MCFLTAQNTNPSLQRASSASQFVITDIKQSICSTAIRTKKAKLEIFRDTENGRASLRMVCKTKAFSVNKK